MQDVCSDSEMTQILASAQRCEPEAMDRLYVFYADKIFRYILYRVMDRNVAEDLTAEVFIRLLENLPRFRVNEERPVASFSAWLYRIAGNLIADHYRAKGRGADFDVEEQADTLAGHDDMAEALDRVSNERDLHTAIAGLNEEQRQVILFKFVEGMDNREVAKSMGKTEGAIKSLQHRALANLAQMLRRVHL